jgi:Methyltransferase domain
VGDAHWSRESWNRVLNVSGEKEIVGRDVPGEPQEESRFTAPTRICPTPNRWHSTDGDSTEIEVSELAFGLVRALQPSFCVETGSGFGQTAVQIAQALRQNNHGHLVTIEPDERRFKATSEVLKPFERYAFVFRRSSLDYEPISTIDFAWLDSFYELRVPEFLHFRPWMHEGTIVCFHDTAPEHGAHRIASGKDLRTEIYDELIGRGELVAIELPTPRGLMIAQVVR